MGKNVRRGSSGILGGSDGLPVGFTLMVNVWMR